MTSAAHPMAGWLLDLESAFEETARGALGIDAFEVAVRDGHVAPGWQGAYLGLVGPTGALQIGIAAEEEVCQTIAKALLAMDPGAEALPAPEMADAVCELVNIVAGTFKGKVRDRAPQLSMGLPTFFHGGVQATERTAVRVTEVRTGGHAAALVLITPRGNGAG